MLTNADTDTARPYVPTLAEILQRGAELGLPPQTLLKPQPQPRDRDFPPIPIPAPRPLPNPQLGQAAYHGLAGRILRTIAPHTEAHPAAVLLQLLAAFGNMVGPGPHCMVDATRHGLNLFLVLVGDSSKARKGTSWSLIARLFAEVDQPWYANCVSTARLTASGLVYALRDQQPPTDRRLLALSEEFASVLQNLKRNNGHLSPLLRCAWDSGNLTTLDMHQHLQATGTHLSFIAHITQPELATHLHRTEALNGFANRCLWTCVQRSNCLPEGGSVSPSELSSLAGELRKALDWATASPQILFRRDAMARELWQHRYPGLSQLLPGLHGAATSRAEAQVLRISAIYAALDGTCVIGLPHLQAAFAVWEYCYASASLLFGLSTGDPVADRIREAIESSDAGLSKNQIRRLFHGHVDGSRIDAALEKLVVLGALAIHSEPTGGRPSTVWSPIEENQPEENLESEDVDREAEEE